MVSYVIEPPFIIIPFQKDSENHNPTSEVIRATRHHAPMYGNIPFKNVSKTTPIMLHSYTILTLVTLFIYVRYWLERSIVRCYLSLLLTY